MLTSKMNHHLLYLAWKLNAADPASSASAQARLLCGDEQHLYRLRAWGIADGEVSALLVPQASLDQIAEAIWAEGTQPTLTRWVASPRACEAAAAEIAGNRTNGRTNAPLAA